MLAQKQAGGQLALVAFSHHSLSSAEQIYTVTDREMLAVVLAVKKFRVYLSSQPFVLVTDHAVLKWLNSLAVDEARSRRARWIEYIQQFQMNPTHRPGTSPELSMADYLPRVKQTGMQKVIHCLSVLVMESKDDGAQRLSPLFTVEEVRQAQEECPAVGPVLAALKRNRSDSTTDMSKESQKIIQRKSRLVAGADGLLRYKEAKCRSTSSKPFGKKTIQVVVLPRALRRSFLELVYSKPLNGHMERNRNTDTILTADVDLNGQKSRQILYVVDCQGPALLGRAWLESFQLHWPGLTAVHRVAPTWDALQTKYTSVFNEEQGCFKGATAKLISKSDATPKFVRARQLPMALKPKVEAEIWRMEKAGILTKVNWSEWATPVVPVVKPNGQVRLCGDFKVTVNPQLHVDQHPLPRIDEIFATLSGGKQFSKLDLKAAYTQMCMDEDSKPLLTLNTHLGLYRLNRLPYGVASAPALWQRAMDALLGDLPNIKMYD